MLPLFLASFAFAGVDKTLPPGRPVEGGPHYDLELLYHQHDYKAGLDAAKAALAANPNDADLYWLTVRFMFEVAEGIPRTDTSFDKLGWYQEMADLADKGLALQPKNAHLLFAKGIALGRYGTTKGVLSSLFLAKDVEDAWLASSQDTTFYYTSIGGEEELPCDAFLTLGIFYRLVPESWLVQAIAGTRGDLAKSVAYNRQADQCAPNKIGTMKELGVSLLCWSERRNDPAALQEGIQVLSRASAIPPVDPTDRIDIKHILMLISDSKMACGYSRDGQQDLDEKQLEKKGE
jgi:hypothetical protein